MTLYENNIYRYGSYLHGKGTFIYYCYHYYYYINFLGWCLSSLIPDHGIAALPHFFGKCHTMISPRGPKGTKKEINLLQNVHKHTLYISL